MTEGRVVSGAGIARDLDLTCDVCVVGSGAGGAVLAAGLAARGLSVVVLEEGGDFTRASFTLQEADAYPAMYQGRGGRATADQAIVVLQGRTVGGSTTVNWTTSFRTPDRILAHWAREHGVAGLGPEDLRPHFEAVEARLGIAEWPEGMANANNRVLLDGARKLGWEVRPLRRNVRDCKNTGYCGLGCPVDAKQGMRVTYVPDALAHGAAVYADVRADRLVREGARVVAVEGTVLRRADGRPAGPRVRVRPKVAVSSAGALNGPALLLRSGLDGDGLVGRRTFLHPVVALPAVYPHPIEGWYGAPQSVGSHQHIDRGPDRYGFFLETPPLQPMLAASGIALFGKAKQEAMGRLANTGVLIALAVDGLLPGDDGGTVSLRGDGRLRLDYPIRPALAEAFRDMHEAMARVELAAGATMGVSTHVDPVIVRSEADLPALAAAPYGAHAHAIFTAHQMGGCPMGADPARHVVDADHRFRGTDNLFVVDGSVFPTALGVNPSETIYALAHRAVERVAAAV